MLSLLYSEKINVNWLFPTYYLCNIEFSVQYNIKTTVRVTYLVSHRFRYSS